MGRRDRIAEPWGRRTPYGRGASWPVRVDAALEGGIRGEDVERWVPSASILHSNGDALDIAVAGGRIVGVRGRRDDRVNHGRLDPKDLFAWRANASPDRLRAPLVRREGRLVETDWDTAMDEIVRTSRQVLDRHGPGGMGFYTSGQLFLEEYYTQAVIGRGAIGTNHVDGNTRLCTATAAQALKESFGSDGQPGSYGDIDHADVIALYGHNMAETQTVLWSRILDRLAGPEPPRILCVDPRRTPVSEAATVHLAPLPGTNLALMNGILHELITRDLVDRDYVDAHTVGFAELADRVRDYPPEEAGRISGVDPGDIRAAAQLVASANRLLSTVLEGFYQSNQATAAAVQVNNVHLVLGMLGRPGAGVLQMNGQPTAQNTRECGANGDLPGFRNWSNEAHVAELAELWNVDVMHIPHYAPPTHAMQMIRYAEQGSLRFLWVTATNPAVSLPELRRIRSVLGDDRLFLVVQDLFRTETAELADVVLPAATWGEKTGTFTNSDRTVHLSEKAVDPPGAARSDLDIFLDYARRMDFRDADGNPLPNWHDPESAFEAWKRCSAGRPCDYTGITYERLRTEGGIQWPCTSDRPEGTERLYTEGGFWAAPDVCEDYGKDLLTGAPLEPTEYRAMNPSGKAVLKAAGYVPPHESPTAELPFVLITGRTLYQFHTRTKTGRAAQLNDAAPEVWAELSRGDAERLGAAEGDLLELINPRGRLRAAADHRNPGRHGVPSVPLRILGSGRRRRPRGQRAHRHRLGSGVQAADLQDRGRRRAARRRGRGHTGTRADDHGIGAGDRRRPTDAWRTCCRGRRVTGSGRRRRTPQGESGMKLALALRELHRSERNLAVCLLHVAQRHRADAGVSHLAGDLARWSRQHVAELATVGGRYGLRMRAEPTYGSQQVARFWRAAGDRFGNRPEMGLLLLADLRKVHRKAAGVSVDWELLAQGAQAAEDGELLDLARRCHPQSLRQMRWANARLKELSPQILVS